MTDRTDLTEDPTSQGAEAPEAKREDEATSQSAEPAARPWLPSPAQVHRYKDADGVAEAAAKRFFDSAKRAVDKSDRFIVVLAGGSTPQRLYRMLAEPPYSTSVPWKKTYFAFGDERCVPPDHEDSNHRMAHELLLAPLEIPEHHVLRMKGEQDPATAARRYEVRLGDLFLFRPKRKFDLVLLGVGADGHTASLFPGSEALKERERWVAASDVPQVGGWRLTLTYPALNASRRVLFLATGAEKARVIAEAFGGVEHPVPHPCEGVAAVGARREVLIDHAAASEIPGPSKPDEKPE